MIQSHHALKNSLKDIPLDDAEWIGLREVKEVQTDRFVRDGKPQSNSTSQSHGVMVEVLINGQFGYAATGRRDSKSLTEAARLARLQALKASQYSLFKFSSAERPPTQLNYQSPALRPFPSITVREINDLLVEISLKLQVSPKIVRTEAFASTVETEMAFVSSNGSEGHQKFSMITTDFQATAQNGTIVQRRTDGGFRGRSFQGGWELFVTDQLWDRVGRVSEQALELVAAPDCPSQTLPLILMPDQMMLQIHESIGHPLELDRILGDERNYAGWSFVNREDFGKLQYGSDLMNVTFDPTVSNEFASYGFDDIGNSATRQFLIQEGRLLRGLGSLESQIRSGIPGVANQRASSWNRAPIDRMANINLEPGSSSLDQMIGSIELGVMMESNRSWSIDDFRNKFQFGCEYARLIENGKLTHAVKNPNYRGITIPFWNSLSHVGNGSTLGAYGTPFCGKGEPNQSIRVGHRSPACLFQNVEVFGGA